ncbi:MAG: transcription antitermination protein NusB [Alphaproteobacteria bacterium]|nr:transcription antitermination protein NusB [Alphaproteobacteria bacterium]
MPVTNAKNLSLQKKSASRVAAVQCLYKLAMNNETLDPAKQLSALKVQLFRNPEEQKATIGAAVEPNYPLYEAILTGVKKNGKDIEKMLGTVLSKDWKRERMSPVLIAILQCAISELFFAKETPLKVVQDEYSRLTRSFFGEKEVKFVFAVLSALAESFE